MTARSRARWRIKFYHAFALPLLPLMDAGSGEGTSGVLGLVSRVNLLYRPAETGLGRVMRGDAVRQRQKRLEPGQLAAAIERDVAPALGTGDHRAHRDHQDIEQAMLDLAAAARVLDRTKVLHQGLDGHGPPPRRRESRSSRVRPGQASEISCVAPGMGPRPRRAKVRTMGR